AASRSLGFFEIGIEIVEYAFAALDPLLIVARARANAGDQGPDSLGFRAPELAILEVDVVDDFGDRGSSGVIGPKAACQHLHGAGVADVRELRFEHVEADFPVAGTVM